MYAKAGALLLVVKISALLEGPYSLLQISGQFFPADTAELSACSCMVGFTVELSSYLPLLAGLESRCNNWHSSNRREPVCRSSSQD